MHPLKEHATLAFENSTCMRKDLNHSNNLLCQQRREIQKTWKLKSTEDKNVRQKKTIEQN